MCVKTFQQQTTTGVVMIQSNVLTIFDVIKRSVVVRISAHFIVPQDKTDTNTNSNDSDDDQCWRCIPTEQEMSVRERNLPGYQCLFRRADTAHAYFGSPFGTLNQSVLFGLTK